MAKAGRFLDAGSLLSFGAAALAAGSLLSFGAAALAAGSLLSFGAATLTAAALALKNARRYVEVAEERMEHLREEQSGILKGLREEHRALKEESKQEQEQRLELQQKVGRMNREFEQLRQEHGRLAEKFERECARRLEYQQQQARLEHKERERERERLELQQKVGRMNREFEQLRQEHGRLAEKFERECARRLEYQQQQARLERKERERERERLEAERKIDRLKRELQALRETKQARETQQENPPSVPVSQPEELPESRKLLEEKPLPVQRVLGEKSVPVQRVPETSKTPRPANSSGMTPAAGPTEAPPKSKRPRLGVRMPHPDDETDRGKVPAVQTRSGAQVEMFRKYYDRYLENYQGYVELAEGLYRTRENGEVSPGSVEEREWREKLRRAKDGIARTTSRLDILEEHNPELASDNRISERAGVARRHAELNKRSGAV